MKVRFSPRSARDFHAITNWIAAERSNAARKVVRNLRAACLSLANRPYAYEFLAGRQADAIRRAPHSLYIICYRIEEEDVIILHILDGARDAPSLF
jgi:plasmid stabilization system protein ParE